MTGAYTILHFHDRPAMIGTDTLVTVLFWLYKQAAQTHFVSRWEILSCVAVAGGEEKNRQQSGPAAVAERVAGATLGHRVAVEPASGSYGSRSCQQQQQLASSSQPDLLQQRQQKHWDSKSRAGQLKLPEVK
jgi:hypothetical protein